MKNILHLIPKVNSYKNGSKIHIKKKNEGKFTDYCGGKVTDECILRALHSSNPKLVKRANFARNARKWKHAHGGILYRLSGGGFLSLLGQTIGNIGKSYYERKNKNLLDEEELRTKEKELQKIYLMQKLVARDYYVNDPSKLTVFSQSKSEQARAANAGIKQSLDLREYHHKLDYNDTIKDYKKGYNNLDKIGTGLSSTLGKIDDFTGVSEAISDKLWQAVDSEDYKNAHQDLNDATKNAEDAIDGKATPNNIQAQINNLAAAGIQGTPPSGPTIEEVDPAEIAEIQAMPEYQALLKKKGDPKTDPTKTLGDPILSATLTVAKIKKGKKLKRHLINVHKTHGLISVLDDTGVVNNKTLKLK